MTALKLTRIGNSVGVVLPKDILSRLRLEAGDSVSISESPVGDRLSAHDEEFDRQMGAAEQVMRENRDVLRLLAKWSGPAWLHDRVVEALHLRQLSEHGGAAGIRDRALPETARA